MVVSTTDSHQLFPTGAKHTVILFTCMAVESICKVPWPSLITTESFPSALTVLCKFIIDWFSIIARDPRGVVFSRHKELGDRGGSLSSFQIKIS